MILRHAGLMIAEPQHQEGLAGKVRRQPLLEVGVVARAERLAPDVLVDLGVVAEVAPVRRELRPQRVPPGEVIEDRIDEDEQRLIALLALDHLQGLIVVEAIGFDVAGLHLVGIEKAADAGGLLELARAEKRAIGGIERDGLVAAAPQRLRQAALDAAGGDARDVIAEPAVGPRREAGQHVVFGVPGRAARALDQQRARLAVERPEMIAVVRRHLDAGNAR